MSEAWNLGLPPMQPWRLACFVGEILLDLTALSLALYTMYKITHKLRLHWNLKFLAINVFIMIIVTMASRIPLAIDVIGDYLSEITRKLLWYIHDTSICASSFIQVIIAIERTAATICCKHYETKNHRVMSFIGLGIAWSAQVILSACIALQWINIMANIITFVLMDTAVIIIYATVFRKNCIQQLSTFITKPLSEQYQILENLRSMRPLIILIILQLLHNCLIDSLMLLMIFYIVPARDEEMHAILDVVFNISTAILFCCFSLPFLVYKTKRETWKPLDRRCSLLYRNNRIYTLNSEDGSIDHGDIHFQQLISVWM